MDLRRLELVATAVVLTVVTPATGRAQDVAKIVTRANVERLERGLAHDSMEGRRVGTRGAERASRFIANEMRRIGLEPVGDNGTYYQAVTGTEQVSYTSKSTFTIDGKPLVLGRDYTAAPTLSAPRTIENAEVIFGGITNDTANAITAAQANGRVVVMLPALPGSGGGRAGAPGGGRAGGRSGGGTANPLSGALAVITVNHDLLKPADVARVSTPAQALSPRAQPAGAPPAPTTASPLALRMNVAGASKLFGDRPFAAVKAGTMGGRVSIKLDRVATPRPGYTRNVIGVIRGTDPQLKDEWVLIDAHYDHLGISTPDSTGDSIFNGADDDASGTVAVLEIARALKRGPAPKRSIIFAAMTGEESGLVGTNFYIARPYVPMSKLVANMEIEMIGRADSLAGGYGKAWLTGYERSTMGDMLKAAGIPVVQDPRPSQNFFSRSDNRAFACMGIPAHTLSTFNLHTDYHRRSDEADTIEFDHMTDVIRAGARAARILADGVAPKWHPDGSPQGTSVCPGTTRPAT